MEPPSGGLPLLDGVRVLIVDDHADARYAMCAMLKLDGATVTAVASAREAFDTLQHERPDVLVSDLSMPEEDGYWLIANVRALSASSGGATPAAAVTGHNTAEDRARVLRAGFQFHVPKPVDPNQLVGIVAVLALKE
jgi:CheY-like chemotaxis protein